MIITLGIELLPELLFFSEHTMYILCIFVILVDFSTFQRQREEKIF